MAAMTPEEVIDLNVQALRRTGEVSEDVIQVFRGEALKHVQWLRETHPGAF
jgi:hypothetical protein